MFYESTINKSLFCVTSDTPFEDPVQLQQKIIDWYRRNGKHRTCDWLPHFPQIKILARRTIILERPLPI
jgi:hypothetical protein